MYHNIKTQPFKVKLTTGVHNDRFYLTFTNRSNYVDASQSKTSSDTEVSEIIDVKYENTNQMLQITNEDKNTTINQVYLYNLVGQLVNTWDVRNENQANIQIQMNANTTGVYIVKIETTNGTISKNVSIK